MPDTNTSTPDNKRGLRIYHFSLPRLLIFVIVFGLIGGYVLWRSFATGPLVASLEAEQMSLPVGSSVVSDSTASGGQAIKLINAGAATGSVNFPSSVSSLTVIAKGVSCSGAPTMTVSLDNANLLSNTAVSAGSWTSYSFTPTAAWNSGGHNLSISFTNPYAYTKRHGHTSTTCSRALYLDVTSFYGPNVVTPPPTVTLSASPTSVSTGSSSTLTWNSTNATACTASSAWSGAEPTSGSTSTGALNQTSTYTLTCTGAGGSTSASASVTVSGGTSGTEPAPIAGLGYKEVFDDEFDTFNTNVWSKKIWYGNEEASDEVYVQNGILNLKSISGRVSTSAKNPYGNPNIDVTTMPGVDGVRGDNFRYGFFEARMNWNGQQGSWPAFWLFSTKQSLNTNYPNLPPGCTQASGTCLWNELDAFEGDGSYPSYPGYALHRNTSGNFGVADTSQGAWPATALLVNNWHTYQLLWTPTTVKYYLDDQLYATFTPYDSTPQYIYLILSQWQGGSFSGKVANAPYTYLNQIDYVHVWQDSSSSYTQGVPSPYF